eukprot:TRINITY_DN980_c0_g2_i2.p1 TRINITY_DN980_c0_g2~~TRINITY_DN980_c0_g2_i2.p1  ORF type:complete len:329 (+),score=39.97 TRINITY_DN980_c0_g2_i2:393-1379(+)
MLHWLFEEGGEVAIHDATNSTIARRQQIRERCESIPNLQVIFLESICDDDEVLEKNIMLKLNSPDYRNMDPVEARNDFLQRLANYAKAYQSITDESSAYIKVVNVGRQIVVNRIKGYLPGQIVFYLMNMHTEERTIYLTRHGESRDNVLDRIGGDALLSERGEEYSRRLGSWVRSLGLESLTVWTSTLRRTIQTARFIPSAYPRTHHRLLNELYAGSCEGMAYSEIAEKMPEVEKGRTSDKLNFRYPRGGESYQDLIIRLRPMIIELERIRGPVLLIAHQAVLRTIYSYFMGEPIDRIPYLSMPLHTVIALQLTAHGCEETRIKLLDE